VLLGETLRAAIRQLSAAQVPSPRMNAELLLMFTLGCDRAHLYGHPERELTQEENSRYQEALAQRATGLPAQYITGHQEFWGMDFIVSPQVLIPRPETEHVVERVLQLLRDPRVPSAPGIVDVGTGSGCIAVALAKELPQAEVHATDISADALDLARANASRHNLQDRIVFHQTDLLAGIEKNAFDVVVSNPPYVGLAEEDQVQLEVRKFEPRNAVFAGETGLEVIHRLVPQAYEVLKPGGWLVMEISGTIVGPAKQAVSGWENVQVLPDLQSIPRVLSAQSWPEGHCATPPK
jgi:release factor glutamine methyltransferase